MLSPAPRKTPLHDFSTLELAQALAERLTIAPIDWHRAKGNRKAQASQQIAAGLSFLLHDQPELALEHLQQAVGWLDRSLSAPPCPTHGKSSNKSVASTST
ncbi:MAG: DUF6439 family protein [Spirulinaceae cyanobacterium]